MALKTYTMRLDEENMEKMRSWLKRNGMTMGKFVNVLIDNFVKAIEGEPHFGAKPVKDMTIEEFGQLAKYWMSYDEQLEGKENEDSK